MAACMRYCTASRSACMPPSSSLSNSVLHACTDRVILYMKDQAAYAHFVYSVTMRQRHNEASICCPPPDTSSWSTVGPHIFVAVYSLQQYLGTQQINLQHPTMMSNRYKTSRSYSTYAFANCSHGTVEPLWNCARHRADIKTATTCPCACADMHAMGGGHTCRDPSSLPCH